MVLQLIIELLKICGIFYYLFVFLFRWIFAVPVLIYLLFTRFYWITLIYMVWYFYDIETPIRGGRKCQLYRILIKRTIAPYFPVTMIKTAELPPDRNYIFGLHPHGIFSFSHSAVFATEGTEFSKKFPGLNINICTLSCYFWLPVHRDIMLLTGAVPASRPAIDYILSKEKNCGRGVAIVVGGAREMVATHPGCMNLTLKGRKGFIRMALRHGASLVPVISLGENDIYHTIRRTESNRHGLYFKLQDFFCRVLMFPIIFFYGRGLLPYKKPLNVIIGKPIDVAKPVGVDREPSQDQIDDLHQTYIEELTKLYDEHKTKFGFDKVSLIIE